MVGQVIGVSPTPLAGTSFTLLPQLGWCCTICLGLHAITCKTATCSFESQKRTSIIPFLFSKGAKRLNGGFLRPAYLGVVSSFCCGGLTLFNPSYR